MLVQRSDAGSPRALAPPPIATAGISLFFDFDGTLVELADRPDAIIVPAVLHRRLARLAELLPGRIGIVSGRSIAQLDRYLGESSHRFVLAGSHGAERRLPGERIDAVARPEGLERAEARLWEFARPRDLIVEPKSLGVALHYRAYPDVAEEADALARHLCAEHALVLQRGKMMVELRAPGDKGSAITAMLTLPGMAGTHPLFFGDDVTDEDGFRAAAAVGGAGVLIGEPRASDAAYRLPDVAALGGWIDTLLESA